MNNKRELTFGRTTRLINKKTKLKLTISDELLHLKTIFAFDYETPANQTEQNETAHGNEFSGPVIFIGGGAIHLAGILWT